MSAEPIIEPIVEPIGEVIRGAFGNGSPQQLVPAEGTPTNYAKPGQQPAWPGVFAWVRSHFLEDTKDAVQLNIPGVLDAILAGMSRLQSALSGFHNLAFDYTATVAAQTHLGFKVQQRILDVAAYHLQQQIDVNHLATQAQLDAVRTELVKANAYTQQQIHYSYEAGQAAMRDYVQHAAVVPLIENLGRLNTELRANTDQKVAGGVQLSTALSGAAITAATASLPAIRAALNALQKEADDCTKPMCDTLGPKTDLFKALKGLSALLGLLAGLSLATLTEHDLERIAAAFGAISAGSLDQFFASFVSGGATVGTASGAVAGELTSAGAEALRTLGVPI